MVAGDFAGGADFLAGAIHGGAQPVGREGFEEIIHRIHIECSQGISVISGGEDDAWQSYAGEPVELVEQSKAIRARHADVEEKQLRCGFAHNSQHLSG